MAGFIEFNMVCPKCKENTGVLDIGKIYEEYHCTKCDFSKITYCRKMSKKAPFEAAFSAIKTLSICENATSNA